MKITACVLLVLACVAGVAGAQRKLLQPNNYEPTQPFGDWQSISVASLFGPTYCGLRNFPPIPNGYGAARMLCGGSTAKYDPYWVWKITKVVSPTFPEPLSPNATNITAGELVNLRVFNPMLTFCHVRGSSNQIWCGVQQVQATTFIIEAWGKPYGEQIDFGTDYVYLRNTGSGSYCRPKGSGSSTYIFCDSAAAISAFQMPFSHKYPVQLTNAQSRMLCGADFIPPRGFKSEASCMGTNETWSNYYTDIVFAAEDPAGGNGTLCSNCTYAMLGYDTLYHYQVGAWKVDLPTAKVEMIPNNTNGPNLWFVVEKFNATAGALLESGDLVAIKSKVSGQYCGIASSSATLMCDLPTFPTAAQLGYQYAITF